MKHAARRVLALAAFMAIGGSGAVFAACSATPHEGFDADAGSDATTAVDAPPMGIDSPTSPVDAPAAEVAPPEDAGGPVIKGGCSPVNGPACDIVLQNCAPVNGKTQVCVVAAASDGGRTTQCRASTASQHLPKGHSCCPSAAAEPCLPGLKCIGSADDTCAADAALTGRCSPACCDDNVCGKSDPEGFAGRCELNIVSGAGNALYKTCQFNQQCRQFQVQACPQGFTCLLSDAFGTSSCSTIFNPEGGAGGTEGHACESANACADGLMCLGPPDGGSTCQYLCLTPGTNPPFDAGALRDGAPGRGGCPANERCNIGFVPSQAPNWISICGP